MILVTGASQFSFLAALRDNLKIKWKKIIVFHTDEYLGVSDRHPAIMSCKTLSCVVPDERKSDAVYDAINASVNTSCPATLLRRHENTVLWLDKKSAL